LSLALKKLRQSRRLAEDEQQHAGRGRVERTGVPDALFTQRAPHARHDVVRGRASGLVDDQQAVHLGARG